MQVKQSEGMSHVLFTGCPCNTGVLEGQLVITRELDEKSQVRKKVSIKY